MPAPTKRKGLFVSGTGTGVGKTIVAAALARHLKRAGIDVGVMKPLETGVASPENAGEDAQLLAEAAQSTESLERIAPYRFKTPAAPATAARLEQQPVDYSQLIQDARELVDRHDFTLIEGAGGLMVPVAGGFLIADLAREIGLELLVVADPFLGTINHTLTTLLAARYLEIPVAGYIINRMPADPSPAEKAVPHDLASLTIEELLAVIPAVEGTAQQQVERVAELLPNLASWPLLKRFLPHH